jgi:putative ABC transport system permease protein
MFRELRYAVPNLIKTPSFTFAAGTLYTLISYSVSQRTRETGIGMALGTAQNDVLGQIIREGFRLILFGTLIGIALATALSHALAKFVFGIGELDPAIYGLVIVILSAVALGAAWLPARPASRVDPTVALRYE